MQLHAISSAAFRLPTRAAAAPPATPPEESAVSLLPEADRAFLRQAAPQGRPEELEFFLRLGRKFYGEGEGQELLARSMQGISEWIDKPWEKSALAALPRHERVAMLEKLVEAAPPEKKEYVLHHSDVLRPLQFLQDIVETNEVVPNNSANLGPNERISFVSSPPEHRISFPEAVDHYLGYLDRILHADGRMNPTKELNEDHAAWNCVMIEQNVLHGEPERVEMFSDLVSYYHSPWPALGVLQQAELVPAEKRAEFLHLLRSRVEEKRAQQGPPENSQDSAKEGDFVGGMSKYLGLVLRAQRPGETVQDAQAELSLARGEFTGIVSKWLGLEALNEAVQMRAPGESTAPAARRLQAIYDVLDEVLKSENNPRGHLELAGKIGRENPEKAAELADCLAYLRRLNPPRELWGDALKMAYQSQDSPLEALRERFHSLEVTGSMQGLDEIKAEIEAALKEGRLQGNSEQLMARFLERLDSLNLVHDDHKVSFNTAREEFFQGPSGNALGYRNGHLTVGGVRLKAR